MTGTSPRTRAYYFAPVERFLDTNPHHVFGVLAAAHTHDLDVEQRQAWEEEIDILHSASETTSRRTLGIAKLYCFLGRGCRVEIAGLAARPK